MAMMEVGRDRSSPFVGEDFKLSSVQVKMKVSLHMYRREHC